MRGSKFLVGGLFLVGSYCYAQTTKPQVSDVSKFEILVGAGPVGAHSDSEYKDWGATKIGYTLGVGLITSLGCHFEIRSRFLWENKGWRKKFDGYPDTGPGGPVLYGPIELVLNRTYATGLILPQYKFGKRGHLSLGVGGYFSKLQRSQKKTSSFYSSTNSTVNVINHDEPYDDGVSFGMGYAFKPLKHRVLSVQLLYSYGLRDTNPYSGSVGGSSSSESRTTSCTLFLSLGF